MLLKSQLRWAGHVARMQNHRLPKIVLFGELSSGYRNRGAPKKRYKDSLKKSLKSCDINPNQWTTMAAERVDWRHSVYEAVHLFERARRAALQEKRELRKTRAASAPSQPISNQYQCRHCTRTCLSRIGLASHERACSRRGGGRGHPS